MRRKDLDTVVDEMQFHIRKATELTAEWWQARTDMTRTMQNMDETTDFFIATCAEALRTERRYIALIRHHRSKAKRLIRRYEKSPMSLQPNVEMKDPRDEMPYQPNNAPRI